MIKGRTAFVFGAGLSNEYGFPDGKELKGHILHLTSLDKQSEEMAQLSRLGHTFDKVKEFRKQFQLGRFTTIDEFIEQRASSEMKQLAKAIVAIILVKLERPQAIDDRAHSNCFYNLLFRQMFKDAKDIDSFLNNPIAFVTYNYDRSLEYFLSTTIQHRFGLNLEDLNKAMKKIKIVHVHGKLGDMSWQSSSYRDYAPETDDHKIMLARNGILNVDEVGTEHNNYDEANRIVYLSENVVFVGSGYHPVNLTKLNYAGCLENKKQIIGTCTADFDYERIELITASSNGAISKDNLDQLSIVDFANKYLKKL